MDVLVFLGLVLLGVGVGAYGTLIGSGGGFLLTPVILLIYPGFAPETVTAMSLAVAAATGLSGGAAYASQRRIDYLAASYFAVTTIPAGALGAFATTLFLRGSFEFAIGLLLAVVAVWLLLPHPSRLVLTPPPRRYLRRSVQDRVGDTYAYSFDPFLALALGFALGFLASTFGFGGGIFYVPLMVFIMRIPAHIAVATSTAVLVFTAGTGSLVHLFAGHYAGVEAEELSLMLGVFASAQIGALISARLAARQEIVTRLLGLAMIVVAARLLIGSLL